MRAFSASPVTKKPYGIRRVCRCWGIPKSTFYHKVKNRNPENKKTEKPGPKPIINDNELLKEIKARINSSFFIGEGHRKIWAFLKFRKNINVSKKRVLRIMKANNLLSPYRVPKRDKKLHDGTISTNRPDLMYGTDASKIWTKEQGWVWLFTAVDHYHGEVVGWHVAKRGTRFAALEPIMQALEKYWHGTHPNCARGLNLRMDNGCQYTSDHFINQIKYWGITPSFAYPREPETNGVVERYNRTLKEQIIYGRDYNSIMDLSETIEKFIDRYNNHWMLEKNGYLSPIEKRNDFNNFLDKKVA